MKTHILLIIGILLLSSCSSMLYTTIDVLRPAAVSFEPHAQNILLVNNTVPQPDYYGHKNELYNQSTKYVKVNTDSLPLFTLSMLSEKLSETNFFDNVDLVLNSVNSDSDFFAIKKLPVETVRNLCNRYDADVILSLDRLKVNDVVGEVLYNDIGYYVALIARYETQWSVSYPLKDSKESYIFHDTIYWEGENKNRQKAFLALPNRADALVDGALYAGENTLKRLMPFWEQSDRYFFTSNKAEMKQGMDSIYARNWSEAIKIWERAYAFAKNSYKGQLAHNLAVANELNGNLEKSLIYAQQAYEYLKSDSYLKFEHLVHVSDYINKVKTRKLELEKVNKQLGD